MKKILLIISSMMVIILVIGTVIYYSNNNEEQLNDASSTEQSSSKTEQPQSEDLQPNNNNPVTYSLQNNELNISHNYGEDWITVPIETDLLFEGEYDGGEQELIEDSYVLTEDRAAFLYSKGPDWDEKRIILTYSLDQGDTWEETVVTDQATSMRFRKIDFLNDTFGYIIFSGGRTMSEEGVRIFITENGGDNWDETNNLGVTRLISDGGFIDETTGFLSFGTSDPSEPNMHVTQNAGDTWEQSIFNMPEKYDDIFVLAEVPRKENNHLIVLVNQGPHGDYKGGKIKGQFISEDNGKTWTFEKEVQPDEAK